MEIGALVVVVDEELVLLDVVLLSADSGGSVPSSADDELQADATKRPTKPKTQNLGLRRKVLIGVSSNRQAASRGDNRFDPDTAIYQESDTTLRQTERDTQQPPTSTTNPIRAAHHANPFQIYRTANG